MSWQETVAAILDAIARGSRAYRDLKLERDTLAAENGELKAAVDSIYQELQKWLGETPSASSPR